MKRITRLLLAAAMIFSLTLGSLGVTASAAGIGSLKDYEDIFTAEQEDDLRTLLADAASETGYNICVVVTDDIGSKTPREYASDMLDETFGEYSDSILLLVCNDFDAAECYDWIDMTGKAAEEYYQQTNDIYDSLYSGLDTDGYYSGVISFCEYFGADSSFIEDLPSAGGFQVALADYDDVLTPQEQTDLLGYMQTCADEIECNVGVVITDDLGGMSDYQYTKNFLETSFGVGADGIALLFNNDRTNMNYVDWIYTYGQATAMYDHQIDEVFDYMYRGFDSEGGDNYAGGISYFCTYLINYKDSAPVDYDDYYSGDDYYYESSGYDLISGVLIPIVVASIVTLIVTKNVTGGYKKKKPLSARGYMDAGRTKYLRRDDIYLRETTTHVRISSSSSGGGGGSRGGGGGRSRSGGGGGGGRRR